MLLTVGRLAREHPFKFGCVFSCAKTSFSDWLVQVAIEKRERIDWKRNATFATFGLVYLGGVQYSLYVPIFSRIFPGAKAFASAPLAAKIKDGKGLRDMLSQVFLDQFVHHPLMYFPAFYCLKEAVNGGELSTGLEKYRNQLQGGPRRPLEAMGALDHHQLHLHADAHAHPVGGHHLAPVDVHPLGDARIVGRH